MNELNPHACTNLSGKQSGPGLRILVISATVREIEPFIRATGLSTEDWADGEIRICSWRGSGLEFGILVAGTGMMATACHLGRMLATRTCAFAIQLGIAGSFVEAYTIGSVVQVTDERIADLGVEEGDTFHDVFELGLTDPDREPWSGGRLKPYPCELKALDELPKVCSISVNRAHGSEISIQSVVQKYNPHIENMEGAAFFYACRMAGVRCVLLRAISNQAERRNREAWDIPLAIRGLCDVASAVMDELTGHSD